MEDDKELVNAENSNPVETPKTKSLKDYIIDIKEPMALLLSVGSSLWLFITNLKVSSNFKEFSASVSSFLTFVEFLNVCVLIIAILVLSRKYVLKKKTDETPHLLKLETGEGVDMEISEKEESVNWKITRVNKLVNQLVLSLQGFGVVLLFMYLLLSLTDLRQQKLNIQDKAKIEISDFVNDASEITDAGSEYNKIINVYKKKQDTDVSAINKRFHYSDTDIKRNSYDSIYNRFKNIDNKIATSYGSPPLTNIRGISIDTGKHNQHRPLSNTQAAYVRFKKNYSIAVIKDSSELLKNARNAFASIGKYIQYRIQLDTLAHKYKVLMIDSFAKARGELAIIKKRNGSFEKRNNLIDMIYNYDPIDRFAMRYLIIEFVENAFNLFSAAFLFLAFQVLFTVTLSRDNRTSSINYWLPFSLAGAILLINFLGISIGIGNMPLSSVSHLVRLMSGIFNGVGMMLLFGRFISIEYFYKKADGFKRSFYYIGTICILPLYAIAQPLYGIFDLDNKDIGNALLLKAVVLLICFVGKLFLFLFINQILEREWIHKYFYWILLKGNSMDNVADHIEKDLELTHV